jgi:transmembrane sensor
MNNVVGMSAENELLEQASVWIARMDRQLSGAEQVELQEWLELSPNHFAELTKVARLWDEMETLSRLSDVIPHIRQDAKRPVIRMNFGWAIASVLSIFMAGFLFFNVSSNRGFFTLQGDHFIEESGTHETAIGGLSTVVLTDGSILVLNTNTRVEVSFSQSERLIRLKRGEIHIDVAHDETRPLRVAAFGRVFQAVGTEFNVRIDGSQTVELLVTEGKVKVLLQARSVALGQAGSDSRALIRDSRNEFITTGERLVLDDQGSYVEPVTPTDVAVELSWQDGNIIFRGESLEDAIAEISRYTTIEFLVVDESLQKVRVAGLFKAGDVLGFLESLRANFDIAYEQTDAKTLIYRREVANND